MVRQNDLPSPSPRELSLLITKMPNSFRQTPKSTELNELSELTL
jgi:hypothetical protein